jgi:hypothetical protein
MSRSGYHDDHDDYWALIRWRGAVKSAMRGKRGQALLRDLLAALDAMPEKRLIAHELVTADGEHCALGVLGAARGFDLTKIDPDDAEQVAKAFDISPALAREIVYMNDEWVTRGTPEERWARMRMWIAAALAADGEGARDGE